MSDRKTLFLGCPTYDYRVHWAASRGVWRATRLHKIATENANGSLLARSFNQLWACALNIALQGTEFDYFAMLHSDIAAEDYWLDALIEELEEKQLDMLSVVIPQKHNSGLTSTALHNPAPLEEGREKWRPLCRLTMQEIHALPETFTSDDVGFPLLLNTGCWVIRFDPEWRDKLFFTVNDRMVFSIAQNCYHPEVEPEDWFFSRCCHELGLKLGATRKIKAVHFGGHQEYPNSEPWGTLGFDEQLVQASPVVRAEDISQEPRMAQQLQET